MNGFLSVLHMILLYKKLDRHQLHTLKIKEFLIINLIEKPPKEGRKIQGVGYGDDDYPPISAGNYPKNENFWLNHVDQDGNIVANSGLGNKCKVEVISRSDLLRARGYRV